MQQSGIFTNYLIHRETSDLATILLPIVRYTISFFWRSTSLIYDVSRSHTTTHNIR